MDSSFRPIWLDDAPAQRFPRLDRDSEADVAVIGAGLTGLTTALLLQREGLRVIVLERHRVARAATAHTSGHLTSITDLPLAELVSRFGQDGARLALRAGQEAIGSIERFCGELGLDAGFARVPGFRYTESPDDADMLEQEAELAASLGLPARFVREVPLPFTTVAGVRYDDQAVLQPLRYAAGLARAAVSAGASLYEDTAVEDITAGEPCRVQANGVTVRARYVVHATHTPVGRVIPVQARLAPQTSYVLVARLPAAAPAGLFWDTAQPYHYLRPLGGPGLDRIVAGGSDHKTGQDGEQAFEQLETFVRERFAVAEIERRWSFGLFEPADGLPYIGRLGNDPVWIATGFAGTGLTFGTTAAIVVRDEMAGRQSELGHLLRATRLGPLASVPGIVQENADAAWRLVRDRLKRPEKGGEESVGRGEGHLMEVDGKRAAVYRDEHGELHVLSATCTHLGCIVHWNASASTWDCPCHGGRYLPNGDVLCGPPLRGLQRTDESGAQPGVTPIIEAAP